MINLDKINKLLVFLTDNGIGLNSITINDNSFILDLFENENQTNDGKQTILAIMALT